MATAAQPSPERSPRGRFATFYDEDALWAAVRDVASLAWPADPAKCSQIAFDETRTLAGHPHLPSARQICQRLARPSETARPWRELLAQVFAPDRDLWRLETARIRPIGPPITEVRIRFALRLVAQREGVETLSPDAYSRGRDRVIADDRQWRHGGKLDEALPTALQIVGAVSRIDPKVADERRWDYALALAGLEPRPLRAPSQPKGVPRTDAIELYIERTGWLPTSRELNQFAFDLNFAVERSKHQPAVVEVQRRRRERGMDVAQYAPTGTVVAYDTSPDGVSGWPLRNRMWTFRESIEALRRFDDKLDRGLRRSWTAYKRWATGHDDRPEPKALLRWGGYHAMLRLSRQVDPQEPPAGVRYGGLSKRPPRREWVAQRQGVNEHSDATRILTPEAKARAAAARREAALVRLSLQPLIDAGLLAVGETVALLGMADRHEPLATATIAGDGLCLPGSARMLTPGEAIFQVTGERGDGMTRWKVNRLTRWVPLRALRHALDNGQAERLRRLVPLDQPLPVKNRSSKATPELKPRRPLAEGSQRAAYRSSRHGLPLLVAAGLLEAGDALTYHRRGGRDPVVVYVAANGDGVLPEGEVTPLPLIKAAERLTGKKTPHVWELWRVRRFGVEYTLADLLEVASASVMTASGGADL